MFGAIFRSVKAIVTAVWIKAANFLAPSAFKLPTPVVQGPLQSFMSTVMLDHRQLLIDQARKVYDGIVMRTPVKTGRLRASWRMTHTAQDFSNEPPVVGWKHGMSPLPAPIAPHLSDLPDGASIFISNTVPYGRLVLSGSVLNSPNPIIKLSILGL